MRRLLPLFLLLLTSVAVCSAAVYRVEQVPNVQKADASRYTSNPDQILSEQAVRAIDSACDSLRRASRAQVAVVAIEDIDGGDVFTFAHSLFSSWGVGGEQSDNGLGILLVTARREIRFVTGYGLEGVLTDALCKRIQQRYMVEHLSAGDYSTGMVEGVAAVARLLSDEGLQFEDEEELTDEELMGFFCVMFGFAAFLIIVALYSAWRSRKCPHCGKSTLAKVSTAVVSSTRQYDVMEHYYRCSACGFTKQNREKVYKSTGGPFIGGGFGGGSSGGGGGSFGGGFGGGSFGGGGAGSRF